MKWEHARWTHIFGAWVKNFALYQNGRGGKVVLRRTEFLWFEQGPLFVSLFIYLLTNIV